jgi:hypothetical protein
MDAAAAAAAADTQPFKCKVCLRGFATREGLNVHWGKVCKRVNPKLVQPTASKAQSNASDNVEAAADAETRLAQMYEKEQRTLVLNDLTRFRYDLFTPDSHISQMKTAMQSWLRLANDELIRRLTPLVGAANQPALASIAASTLDIFNNIRTAQQEGAVLRQKLPLLEVGPRKLGPPRTVEVKDAEGVVFRRKQVVDYAYDVPVDASVARLLQEDPRVWEAVQKTMEEWSGAPPERGAERIIADIVDGQVFINHPELGDEARKARLASGGDSAVRLAFILYYDDLTVTNALGVAALTHNYAMFYYALVNLDPGVRMSLKYIQLMTICYSSDLKRYGAGAIIGGGPDDPWDSTSPGASFRRLDQGVPVDLLIDGEYDERTVYGWAIHLAADFPARGKLTPYAESTAAHAFDGKSNYNSTKPGAGLPTSYMVGENPLCDHRWVERSREDLAQQKEIYLAKLRDEGETAARKFLQEIGIKPSTSSCHAFACALLNLPHFDISGLTGMIGEDLMHHELEGLLKWELALMLYTFIRQLEWFTTEELNARIASFPWPSGYDRIPPLYKQHIEEGTADGKPKHDAHVHFHAAQMLLFAQFSVALFTSSSPTPLVKDEAHPCWQSWVAHINYFHQALSHSFTRESIVHFDWLIFRHQTLFLHAYPGYWKPKMAMVCHFPMDVWRNGPLRFLMCLRFEALNQIFKRIMANCNFANPLQRMVSFWNVKSARDLVSGVASSWGVTTIVNGLPEEMFTRPAPDEFVEHLLSSVLQVSSHTLAYVHVVHHLGFDLVAGASWAVSPTEEGGFRPLRIGSIYHDADRFGRTFLQVWWYPVSIRDLSSDFMVPRSDLGEPIWTAVDLEEIPLIPLNCVPGVSTAPFTFVIRRT